MYLAARRKPHSLMFVDYDIVVQLLLLMILPTYNIWRGWLDSYVATDFITSDIHSIYSCNTGSISLIR